MDAETSWSNRMEWANEPGEPCEHCKCDGDAVGECPCCCHATKEDIDNEKADDMLKRDK